MSFGDRRSVAGWEVTVRGDRSMDSDLTIPLLLGLLTLGVAGDALLGVSDKEDLYQI